MRTLLTAGILILASSTSVYAMDNKELCAAHIQKIQDTVSSPGNMSGNVLQRAKADLADARKAQASGADDKCLDITLRTLMKIRQYMN